MDERTSLLDNIDPVSEERVQTSMPLVKNSRFLGLSLYTVLGGSKAVGWVLYWQTKTGKQESQKFSFSEYDNSKEQSMLEAINFRNNLKDVHCYYWSTLE